MCFYAHGTWKRLIYPIHWLGTSQANEHVVPGGEHHSTTLDSPIIVPWRILVLDNLPNEH